MKYLIILLCCLTIHIRCFSQSDEIVTKIAEDYFKERLTHSETLEILSVKKVGILTFRNLIDKVSLDWDDKSGNTEFQIRQDLHEQLTKTEDAVEEPLIFSNRYKVTFRAKNNFGKLATADQHINITSYPPYEKEMWYGEENLFLERAVYKLYFEKKIKSLTK